MVVILKKTCINEFAKPIITNYTDITNLDKAN